MLNKYEKLLRFAEDYAAKNGTSPTLREIAAHMKISVSTAHRYVKKLEEEGILAFGNGKKRCITAATEKVRSKAVPIPVYSDVFGPQGAQFPKENVIFHLWMPSSKLRDGVYFALEAYGDDYLPDGCLPGDFLIFKKTGKIKSGDVAAINDGGKISIVKTDFAPTGFILTGSGRKTEKRNVIEAVGKLIAVQRLNV